MSWRLIALSAQHRGIIFEVPKGFKGVLGRDNDCKNAFVVNDPTISAKHCHFKDVDGDLVVTDNGSTNGVRLNNELSPDPVRLRGGDILGIGALELLVEASGGSTFMTKTRSVIDPIADTVFVTDMKNFDPYYKSKKTEKSGTLLKAFLICTALLILFLIGVLFKTAKKQEAESQPSFSVGATGK